MTATIASPTAAADGKLASRSFTGLLATQFLGAMNDNMFRWIAVPIAKDELGAANALSLGLACFTLPYLLLASPAGYLADRFSKRAVIIGCKIAEIVLMALGVAAILIGNVYALFGVVALMGAQSALFGPSKFGAIPEILPTRQLSKGNGFMGMATVISSAIGVIAGNWLYSLKQPSLSHPGTFSDVAPIALALVGVAIVGWLTSHLIERLPAADATRSVPPNPVAETWRQLRLLSSNVKLMRAALGIAFFWMLASLANLNIDTYGINELHLEQQQIGLLMGTLVAGLGIGSVLAGVLSGGKVELGLVPIGAIGIAFSSLMLFVVGDAIDPLAETTSTQAYFWSSVLLLTLGFGAGFFNIPLEAYIQEKSDVQHRGSILAASNFVSFSLILLASGLFLVLNGWLEMSASRIFLVAGLGTIPVVIYVLALLPSATIRFLVWLASHTAYKVRVYGDENLPKQGGALIVANHVSWLDGIFLLLVSSRPIRMVAYAPYVNVWGVRRMAKWFGVIPIDSGGNRGKAILRSLKAAREAVAAGELVCIFAEGAITRNGQLQPFQRGMMRVVEGTGAPVIPVYLDELWGSVFSYHGGRFFWKWPRRWPYPVSITFGKPLTDPDDINEVREAVQSLGVESVQHRKDRELIPPRRLLRNCRRKLFSPKVADSTGANLTGGKFLTGALAFRRMLTRELIGPEEEMVGILLPPTAAGAVANTAVTLMGKVAVNLNYTLTNGDVNYCVDRCKIKHVLTSRRFIEQRPYELHNAKLVYLEDLKDQVSKSDKLVALAQAYAMPVALLERYLGLTKVSPDDLITVIFTSGSTGEPKGVMLSHHNVSTNIEGADHVLSFDSDDILLGILPFFHSFGYTLTLWLPGILDVGVVYHVNPGEAKMIGKLCEKHKVTITAATPTFLKAYMKRCTPEQFRTLQVAVLGAEKMPKDLSDAFFEKFGMRPTEGYGTTELSPLVSANIPDRQTRTLDPAGTREGSVGRPIPGVTAKIIDPDTGAQLGTNQPGLLWIKGPNVMQGYLDQPERTAEVVKDGWYNTGDIGMLDDEGFIYITGRQSRFSKIGGEMVPHIKIEELLARIVEDPADEEGALQIAVTAVPDEKKGERLIVIHRTLNKSIDEVLKELGKTQLPNLFLPSKDSFFEVEEIPLLGTGKLDLRGLKQLAMEKCGLAEPEQALR